MSKAAKIMDRIRKAGIDAIRATVDALTAGASAKRALTRAVMDRFEVVSEDSATASQDGWSRTLVGKTCADFLAGYIESLNLSADARSRVLRKDGSPGKVTDARDSLRSGNYDSEAEASALRAITSTSANASALRSMFEVYREGDRRSSRVRAFGVALETYADGNGGSFAGLYDEARDILSDDPTDAEALEKVWGRLESAVEALAKLSESASDDVATTASDLLAAFAGGMKAGQDIFAVAEESDDDG